MQASVLQDAIAGMLGQPQDISSLVETLRQVRFRQLARLLHLRLAQDTISAALRNRCYHLLDALSARAGAQLLAAPLLCEVLRTGQPNERLQQLIEQAATAEIDQAVRLPRLACGIPLDLSLPATIMHPSAGLVQPQAPDQPQCAAGMALMNHALTIVEQAHPAGHALFCGLVSNIVMRHDLARATECWGASSGAAIGRVVVVNPVASGSTHLLGEVLLHEATHCALDCAELLQPLAPLSASGTVDSPWSGNPLTPHAFIHACVVWAVLYEYWTRQAYSAAAKRRIDYIVHGFSAMENQPALHALILSLSSAAQRVVALARNAPHLKTGTDLQDLPL
jgi:hypothetical protein